MKPLEALLQAQASTFLLEVIRLVGLVLVAPLPWSTMPARFRAGLVLALAAAIHGQTMAAPGIAGHPILLAFASVSEFMIGAALGFVVRLAVMAGELAADVAAPMMGLGMVQVFDPQAHTTHSVLTTIFRNLTILLALLMGLHRILLRAILASFELWPPGGLVSPAGATLGLLKLSGLAWQTGLRLVLPVVGVLFITQIALAFISRAAPAMQIFSVGFAVTLGVGTIVVLLVLPDVAQGLVAELSHVGTRLEHVLLDLKAGP